MPIFALREEHIFPPVDCADKSGILAIGGDLSSGRLIEAYRHGIFPWYSEGDPIIWWSPDPRFVLFPNEMKISKSMKQILKRALFTITFDKNFPDVIQACSETRKEGQGTWITEEMANAYCELHRIGYAHSVEVWHKGILAGGLYGVSLGRCFFGESMFTRLSNASKAALITLVKKLEKLNFCLIDCQVYTNHLKSLGARHIPRKKFLQIITEGLKEETLCGNWGPFLDTVNSGSVEEI